MPLVGACAFRLYVHFPAMFNVLGIACDKICSPFQAAVELPPVREFLDCDKDLGSRTWLCSELLTSPWGHDCSSLRKNNSHIFLFAVSTTSSTSPELGLAPGVSTPAGLGWGFCLWPLFHSCPGPCSL